MRVEALDYASTQEEKAILYGNRSAVYLQQTKFIEALRDAHQSTNLKKDFFKVFYPKKENF